jgi:hypothetical protein
MSEKIIEVEAELVDNDVFSYHVNRKVWQILWDAIMTPFGFTNGGKDFSNDIFEHHPYSWDDSEGMINNCHFCHKPSGFKIQWYKYPLRGANCNMNITDSQFVDILYDCLNSLQTDKELKVYHDVDDWWSVNEEDKDK